MSLAVGIGLTVILLFITGIIIYIIVVNSEVYKKLDESKDNTAKLSASVKNTQDVITTSLVSKDSVNNIQTNMLYSMEKNDAALKTSVTTALQSVEKEAQFRIEKDTDIYNRLRSSSNVLQEEIQKRVFQEQDYMKRFSTINTNAFALSNSLNTMDNMYMALDENVSTLSNNMLTFAEDIDMTLFNLRNSYTNYTTSNDIDIRNINDTMSEYGNNFSSSNVKVFNNMSFGEAEPSSYMLTVVNSNLSIDVEPLSASVKTNGLVITDRSLSATNPVHAFRVDGTARHASGLELDGMSCVKFNNGDTNQLADANRICYGTENDAPVLNIYGGGRIPATDKSVKIFDHLDVKKLSVQEIILGNNVILESVSSTGNSSSNKLLIKDMAGAPIAAFFTDTASGATGSTPANRFEIYAQKSVTGNKFVVATANGAGTAS